MPVCGDTFSSKSIDAALPIMTRMQFFYKNFSQAALQTVRQVKKRCLTPQGKPKKWLTLTLSVYVAYMVICGLILPRVLHPYVTEAFSSALHTQCSIRKLSFNPVTLKASARDIRVPYPADGQTFLEVERVELSPGLATFFRLTPALGHLRITRPRLYLTVSPDGRLSTDQFFSSEAQQLPEQETRLFPFIIHKVELIQGRVLVDDQLHRTATRFAELMAFIPFASTLEKDARIAIRPTLNGTLNGKFFSVDGVSNPLSPTQRTEFQLQFLDVPLSFLQPYVTPHSTLVLDKGKASAVVSLHFEKQSQSLSIGLAGALQLYNLSVKAPKEGTVLTLPYGSVNLERLLFSLDQLAVTELTLCHPRVTLARTKSGEFNWGRYFQPDPTFAAEQQKRAREAKQRERKRGSQGNASLAVPPGDSRDAATGGQAVANKTAVRVAEDPDGSGNGIARQNIPPGQQITKETEEGSSRLSVSPPVQNGSSARKKTGAYAALSARSKTPLLRLDALSVRNATVVWQDSMLPEPISQRIGPLNVHAADISTRTATNGTVAVLLGDLPADVPPEASPLLTPLLFGQGTAAVFFPAYDKEGPGQRPTDTNQAGAIKSSIGLTNSSASATKSSAGLNAGPDQQTFAPQASQVPDSRYLPAEREGQNKNASSEQEAKHAKERKLPPHIFSTGAPSSLGGGAAVWGTFAFTADSGDNPFSHWLLQTEVQSRKLGTGQFGRYLTPAGLLGMAGTVEAKTAVSIAMNGTSVRVKMLNGTAGLADCSFQVTREEVKGTCSLKSLVLKDVDYSSGSEGLRIGDVQVESPTCQLTVQPPKDSSAASANGVVVKGAVQGGKTGAKALSLPFVIAQCAVNQGFFSLRGEGTGGSSLRLDGIQASAGNLTATDKQPLTLTATGRWNTSGRVSVQGKGTLAPLQMQLKTSLSSIPLSSLAFLANRITVLDISAGTLSCDVDTQIAERSRQKLVSAKTGKTVTPQPGGGSGMSVTLRGKAQFADVRLRDKGQEVFSFTGLRLAGVHADTDRRICDIGLLAVDSPKLVFTLFKDGMNTLSRALDVTGEQARKARREHAGASRSNKLEEAVSQAGKDLQEQQDQEVVSSPEQKAHLRTRVPDLKRLSFGKVLVTKGAISFRDETLPRKSVVLATDIALEAERINSEAPLSSTMQMTGRIEGATLSLAGIGTPLFQPIQGNATLTLTGMDLVPLSPYAEKYTDYPIESGDLSLDMTLMSDGTVLQAANGITLRNMELGSKLNTPGAPSMPIKTGLSLLADGNGNIALSLPVKGRLADPRFRTGGVVTKAFGNLFFKVMFSPFTLLGSVFGGSDTTLQYITFLPGDDRITRQADETVKKLVDTLQKRQNLIVVLHGMADEEEKKLLPDAVVTKLLQENKWKSLPKKERKAVRSTELTVTPQSDPETYEDRVFDVYRDQPFKKPSILGITKRQPVDVMLAMIKQSVAVDDDALAELSRKRAAAVRQALLDMDPDLEKRISIAPDVKVRSAAQGQPLFSRVELGVK